MTNSIAKALNEATGTVKNDKGQHGMDNIDNEAQTAKVHKAEVTGAAVAEELANVADTDNTVASTLDVSFTVDENNKVLPSSFQAGLKTIAPKLADALPDFVDRTFFSTWSDMFRIANLIELEFGVMPRFHEAGRAWQAAQLPEGFAFDKDTVGYSESTETEGVLEPMSWQEIRAKREQGLRPMSNAQWTFYEETCGRALDGMNILIALRELGYESQHTAEDVWNSAREAEDRRQKNYQNSQELESLRKKEASESAMKEAIDNGTLVM